MRAPNGYGGVSKLPGNRRKPWRVRITLGWNVNPSTGKVKQEYGCLGYYATRKEAMIALAEYNDNPFNLDNRKITFRDVYDLWWERDGAQLSLGNQKNSKSCRKYLASIEDVPIASLKLVHLEAVMAGVADKSTTVQQRVKTLINKTFTYAMEHDIVNKNYTPFLKLQESAPTRAEESKLFTPEEIKAILAVPVERTISDTRHKNTAGVTTRVGDIPRLLLYTGCRINELLSVKVSDVHLDERWMHIPGTKNKNADRTVPIHREIEELLQYRVENSPSEYLFPWKDKQLPYITFLLQFWQPLMTELGQAHTPHDTRHTFISLMDKAGIGSGTVVLKRIVGHSNSSVTEDYTHKVVGELIEVMDKYRLLYE